MSARTLQVRHEGMLLYRTWAEAILKAQNKGEDVPTPGDVDEMVAWLDERNFLVSPTDPDLPSIDAAQARVLIELVQAGGEHTFAVEGG